MAEFCKECFNKMFIGMVKEGEKLVIGEDKELCEGCGKMKQIVIEVKK